MYIGIKPIYICFIQTIIMITANKYLVPIIKVAKPIQEINCLLLAAVHGKIARMHQYLHQVNHEVCGDNREYLKYVVFYLS